jgi:hypothetical protein
MRRVLLLATLLVLAAVTLAACSSADSGPGWTFSPETPPPAATAAPATDAPAPTGDAPSAAPSESHDMGGGGTPGEVITLTSVNIQWVEKELSAPADTEFVIRLVNEDAGVPHNVEIKQNGQTVYKGDIFNGVETRDFTIPALAAGTYEYICTVHPNMVGTLTVGG